MSDVKQCDVCGDTFELKGFGSRHAKVELPFRYKVWAVLPWNRDKVGYVKQDLCRDCSGNLEEALKILKENEQ